MFIAIADATVSASTNAVEVLGVRYRSRRHTEVEADAEVTVIGLSRRGGSAFVKQGNVIERWHRTDPIAVQA